MSADRLNRDQFHARLAPLDDTALRKVLWTLYWRGGAAARQRIETETAAVVSGRPAVPAAPAPTVDPDEMRGRVDEFAALARKGAYLAGDRRVSPKQRTRWRYIFRDLFADARQALAADDPMPAAAAAMATLVDIGCETGGRDYFRSEDPVEAAKIVISDEVAVLWHRVHDHAGLPTFAALAAPQLVRWERSFGWTRSGWGQVWQKETSLAEVLTPMLDIPDAWRTFAGHYLAALDACAPRPTGKARSWDSADWPRRERTGNLAEWHRLLLPRLVEEDDGNADRLVTHPALGGAELSFLQAHLARLRGDLDQARKLVHEALTEQPGNTDFFALATEMGSGPG